MMRSKFMYQTIQLCRPTKTISKNCHDIILSEYEFYKDKCLFVFSLFISLLLNGTVQNNKLLKCKM